jgi:hypothetical protein
VEILNKLILMAILVLALMGSAEAVENRIVEFGSDQVNYTTHNVMNINNNTSHVNSTNISEVPKTASNTVPQKIGNGCCSVLLHVKNGVDVFAYRRDSTYAANLYIKKISWYGKEALKEYKTTNGYFFHTIITKNGWIVSTGGPDVVWINKKMETLAGRISTKGKITRTDMNSAYSLLKKLRMGHFLIKDPQGNVGLAVYYYGSSKLKIFKMRNGEYVSVPNSPRYYRSGVLSTAKLSNPVSAAIYLAGTDRWGVNRRNIITYEVKNLLNITQINIWASFDGGKLIKRYRGKPDNIIFAGRVIYAKYLPRIPNKKFIGQSTLRSYNSISTSSSKTTAKV